MTPIVANFDGLQAECWPWAVTTSAEAVWDAWARQTADFLTAHQADPREALVVLPVGAVLVQARQAWGRTVGGWQPRIDTIAALAESMAFAWAPQASADGDAFPSLTLDPVLDRLHAARSLGQQLWGRQWAQRDRRGFEFALDQVVAAAHTWARRLQAVAPQERSAYGDEARLALGASAGAGGLGQGPGGRERLLLAWALEWALNAAQAGWPSDLLFGLSPSAWVGVSAGEHVAPGTEASLMLSVLRHAAQRGLPVRWDAAQPVYPGAHAPELGPTLTACSDVEDESQQTAAQVLRAVNASRDEGGGAVALIALDRSLIRRVRALLEGAGATVADETGWRLSTTRAATVVSRLIQASHPRATTDEVLDWLKSGWLRSPSLGHGASLSGLVELETWCRRHGLMGAWGLMPADFQAGTTAELLPSGRQGMPPEAAVLWRWAREVVAPLQALWQGPKPSLHAWLHALKSALEMGGASVALAADEAGALAWSSLRLDLLATQDDAQPGAAAGAQAWQGLAHQTRLDGPSLLRWVNAVLEATTFRPPAPEGEFDVVITPLARAVLRPFHAIVMPGVDERQLGAMGTPSGWLSVRLSEAMGLATPAALREAQWEAFALLMSRPRVVCLHRTGQGSEPLEPSAWLERWAGLSGQAVVARPDARAERRVPAQPVPRPMPSLAGGALPLPERVTATSYEALRQCPYRFFATTLLRLRESDELEEGLDRSDFGIWLHDVLRVFHEVRAAQLALSDEAEDVAAWLRAALQVTADMGLDRDGQRPYFMPYQAGLYRLARAYVQWLRAHESEGWSHRSSEVITHRVLELDDGLSVQLHGQLDRMDVRHQDGGDAVFVLDYKTGSLDGLKSKVKTPLEDTQLAFYAALAEAGPKPPEGVQAAYLHLEAKAVNLVPHPNVDEAAQALLQGLAQDWQRLNAGSAMQALGEGAACTHCQARGLCRRDHWSPNETQA